MTTAELVSLGIGFASLIVTAFGMSLTAVWVVGRISSVTESLQSAITDLKVAINALTIEQGDHRERLATLEANRKH